MANLTRIEQHGDNLMVFFDDGSVKYALQGAAQQWIFSSAKGAVTPPSGGGGGGGVGTGIVSPLPTSLAVSDASGASFTLGAKQIQRAAEILTQCMAESVPSAAYVICLITSLTEGTLHNYSNVTHYPGSNAYPAPADADGDGSDNDSVGLFQQRPASGWGTPQQCMTPSYSTSAFLGGPQGPNHGSPRGLLDISGWQAMQPGVAAQTVQVSAFPTRYANYVPTAQQIIAALVKSTGGGGSSAQFQWPFQYSKYVIQSDPLAQFGPRIDPVTHVYSVHEGLDFGNGTNGLPIPAAAAGTVTDASYNGAQGNHVHLSHSGGFDTWYFHMNALPPVHTGDTVSKGQIIGHVGATGWVTGPHLHWETHVNGTPINPRTFMKDRGVPET